MAQRLGSNHDTGTAAWISRLLGGWGDRRGGGHQAKYCDTTSRCFVPCVSASSSGMSSTRVGASSAARVQFPDSWVGVLGRDHHRLAYLPTGELASVRPACCFLIGPSPAPPALSAKSDLSSRKSRLRRTACLSSRPSRPSEGRLEDQGMAMRVNSTPVDRPFLVFAVTASESLGRRPSGRQAMQRFGADTWNTTEFIPFLTLPLPLESSTLRFVWCWCWCWCCRHSPPV